MMPLERQELFLIHLSIPKYLVQNLGHYRKISKCLLDE